MPNKTSGTRLVENHMQNLSIEFKNKRSGAVQRSGVAGRRRSNGTTFMRDLSPKAKNRKQLLTRDEMA
jgi:hypothetical protein